VLYQGDYMVRSRKRDPWRAKQWFHIYAPSMFGNQYVGETPSDDPKKLIGRTIEVSGKELSGDFKKSHLKLCFKVTKVNGNDAHTEFLCHEVSRSYMRAQIRRRNTKVETITNVKTKDGKKLRVTAAGLCYRTTTNNQEAALRKIIADSITESAANLTLEQFVQELFLSKVASDAFRSAKTIYPLRRIEIVKAKVISS
jgi:small subunit ribosomal protein S3Ae